MNQSGEKYNFIFKPKIINYTIFLFFCSYFIIGINIYKDYGISIDEPFHRTSGFYWYLQIIDNFFYNFPNIEHLRNSYNKMEWSQDFTQGVFHEYGVFFDLFATFIENILNLKNFHDIYHLKHFLNFFVFYISSVVFFYLIKNRFKSNILGFIAVLFYISSPRIFAESFYNCKDIIFMSFIVFSLFFGLKILKSFKIKNIILFALFSALATSIRSMGVFTVLLVLSFLIIENLEQKKSVKKNIYILLIFCLYLFFTYLFWPYLWFDPINNFITSLKSFAHFNQLEMSIFYLGDFVKINNLPWHYSFVWIGVSNPIIYSILFLFGSYKIFLSFFTNLDKFWKNLNEKLDLVILAFFFAPLVAVIIFNSTLYNGWRHLYFIYPALIYISIFSLNYFLSFKFNRFYINGIFIIIFLSIFINISNIIKLHPFQNIYFNLLFEKKANTLFDIDYWGLGNAHSIIKILDTINESENVSMGTASFTPLNYSKYIINHKRIKNISFPGTNSINSDYIFTNYVYEGNPKYKKKYLIPKNYKKFYTLKKGNIVINEIYKKRISN